MIFKINIKDKVLVFDSKLKGLYVDGKEYVAGKDGVLIYDQILNLSSDVVGLQMSTNTSTLVPALKVVDLQYPNYFDERIVVESQNDITFYWNKSKLAAFYNRFGTDSLEYNNREDVIRKSIVFLVGSESLDLPEEYLDKLNDECNLLGFYKGFPIFESGYGMPKLLSRLGVHVGKDEVMISTPMDRYEKDVYELAETLRNLLKQGYSSKKNRVVFDKNEKLLQILRV